MNHTDLIKALKGPLSLEAIGDIVSEYAEEMGRDGDDYWAVISGGDTLQWCWHDGHVNVGGGHCCQMFNPTEPMLRRAIEDGIGR